METAVCEGGDALTGLVASLYSTATDPAARDAFASQLRARIGSESVLLHYGDTDGNWSGLAACNIDPNYARLYREHYYKKDPWVVAANSVCAAGVFSSEQLVPRNMLIGTEFYADFLRPQAQDRMICVTPIRIAGGAGHLSANRDYRYGPYDAPAVRVLEALRPHLQATLVLWREFALLKERCAALEDIVNQLPTGVLLLDHCGQVQFANITAEQLLRETGVVYTDGRDLRALNRLANYCLQRAIASAVNPTRPLAERKPVQVELPVAAGGPPVRVLIAPLPAMSDISGTRRPAAIVLLGSRLQAPAVRRDVLTALYRLTPAECGCAALLCEGRSLTEIATHLNVSPNTVRTHLKNLFQKTGTHRQGELVAQLHRDMGCFGVLRLE